MWVPADSVERRADPVYHGLQGAGNAAMEHVVSSVAVRDEPRGWVPRLWRTDSGPRSPVSEHIAPPYSIRAYTLREHLHHPGDGEVSLGGCHDDGARGVDVTDDLLGDDRGVGTTRAVSVHHDGGTRGDMIPHC